MRGSVWVVAAAAAALVALVAGAARRVDADFEFDDDADTSPLGSSGVHSRRPRRYVYDPHNPLCHSLVCKKREVCFLRESFTALCATKKDILRRGDIIVPAGSGWASQRERDDDDDVFYDGAARSDAAESDLDSDSDESRCVGCPGVGRVQFLCGSDNRTYSSLCRLDLHNCVHRPKRPVTLACRGFCPCSSRRAQRKSKIRARPSRRNYEEYDDEWRRRKSESSYNEVLPEKSHRRPSQGSETCALDKMANRLLDWFSVLMDEAAAVPPPEDGFPPDCKPEVRWMFTHLDTEGDGVLSAMNLYSLRHDDRERCLRPFLASCGDTSEPRELSRGEPRGGVTRAAWCGCLRRAARPCTALARAHPDTHTGAYVPACDARGYYRPRQCHTALGVCWCVDAHGVELPGSRTKGAPSCPGEKSSRNRATGVEEIAGAPSDDEDAAGSGDSELRF